MGLAAAAGLDQPPGSLRCFACRGFHIRKEEIPDSTYVTHKKVSKKT
jgi:hypothetical protein